MKASSRIAAGKAVMIFNDMINANFRTVPERTELYYRSGVVDEVCAAAQGGRELGIDVVWVTITTGAARIASRVPVTDRLLREGRDPGIGIGEPEWRAENIDECPILPDDSLLRKHRIDPFFATGLDFDLRQRGVETILLGGVSTPGGVESCARSAYDRGFDVVVMSDCTYWLEEELHEWTLKAALPRVSRVMRHEDALDLIES